MDDGTLISFLLLPFLVPNLTVLLYHIIHRNKALHLLLRRIPRNPHLEVMKLDIVVDCALGGMDLLAGLAMEIRDIERFLRVFSLLFVLLF